jgi:two-component system chemotaxis sensor kinase CheA
MGNDPNKPSHDPGASSSDDLSEYLHVFIEESREELDSLVEAILLLEDDPRNSEALNKAFRMLHSLKGSCGVMGFEVVGNIAHKLEDLFENYRTGKDVLDRETTTLLLRCIDFFRAFIDRLRSGDSNEGDPAGLSAQLAELDRRKTQAKENPPASPAAVAGGRTAAPPGPAVTISGGIQIKVKFKRGLQLADLKARLIVSRLASVGEVMACEPRIEDVHSFEELPLFSLTLLTDRTLEEVRKIANVDGVESIDIEGGPAARDPIPGVVPAPATPEPAAPSATDTPPASDSSTASVASAGSAAFEPSVSPPVPPPALPASEASAAPLTLSAPSVPPIQPTPPAPATVKAASVETPTIRSDQSPTQPAAVVPEAAEGRGQATETLRIDIDRLDRLMNLTGELVVTNARFAQITSEMSPVFRRNSVFNKSKDLTERLRQRFELVRQQINSSNTSSEQWHKVFDGLEYELEGLDEQSNLWDEGHRQFLVITEAVDQLSLVSRNLQRGVLNTRMVPVGPLLNRFKRVIRDVSVERGKRVQLVIHGEKTELDRRMIDALGDPLLHLVRNSIDHGFELPDQRRAAGKPEVGTINISAAHRGNNVLITVKDDGGGINTEKIRLRAAMRGLATESQLAEMTEQQIIDYIWHPGFSTAEQITDISGRGVGMDIVRNAISDLSGSIDVASTPGVGTTFTIRLPLTLAIIRSLLIRFRDGHFSIPIDDVREIVSVPPDKIHTVHRHRTIDVRGELVPLCSMEDLFDWNALPESPPRDQAGANRNINVVLLHARGKTFGLCVDALVGRADIVIKSLTENFVAIRGISGASIMGDGTVCLMLDCTALIELTSERAVALGKKRKPSIEGCTA